MAQQDDPFANAPSDRTIMVPSPGSRGREPRAAASRGAPSAAQMLGERVTSGLNPLLALANPLLAMVPQIHATLQHPDPQALRDSLARDIKEFEQRARAAGIPNETIIAARYALCTLLDEAASSTPWGGSGIWAKNSLLITFHNETSGGEKFFQLLSKLAENPKANLDLLELLDVCLALGFEGRYRLVDNGRSQLEAIRERLAQMIRKERGEYERDLAPHWRGAGGKRNRALYMVPLWVTAAVCGVILLGAYATFSYLLNSASDPVFAKIRAIQVATAAPKPPPAPAPKPRLAPFLAQEIAQGLVAVRDEGTRSVVVIRGDELFPPGSASILPAYEPLVLRIADALNAVPGQVLVSGHTDAQPIRTARFPSNWHLSEERARSVAQLLAERVKPPERLRAEGRAETEPVAGNDTPAERARNRRVEITLIPTRPGG
jgi:type VI secretion system protein ImpK